MKILIVSYYFPPYSTIGAVRVGKTAKYLTKMGHDVRVITAGNQMFHQTLDIEIPKEKVIRTPWLNVNKPVVVMMGGGSSVAAKGYRMPKSGWKQKAAKFLGNLYKTILNFPDAEIGWLPFGVKGASELMEKWKPDVIYASSSPHTSLLVASHLAKKYKIPWVGELRDLWVDNHLKYFPLIRRFWETKLERKVLSSSSGLVTVSAPLSEILEKKFEKPTAVILNGFDPEDYPINRSKEPESESRLVIAYTGMIYEGKYDLVPLFEALRMVDSKQNPIKINFYGRYLSSVQHLANAYGVEHLIEVHDQIPYRESLKVQCQADILLFLLWNDPGQRGIYSGKVFEYLGSRRPILTLGNRGSAAADLIAARQAGVVLNNPNAIYEQLILWSLQKKALGEIPLLPSDVSKGVTREEQTKSLEQFLYHIINLNEENLVVKHARTL